MVEKKLQQALQTGILICDIARQLQFTLQLPWL